MNPKFIIVSSAGKREHIVALCPKCKTICDISLHTDGGLVFACSTLYCGFELAFNKKQALEGINE